MNPEKLIELVHRNQFRKTGDPYTSHLYAVRDILLQAGIKNQDLLNSALLHDILEDSNLSKSYIKFRFGSKVANIVSNLTKKDIWNTSFCKAHDSFLQLESAWEEYPEVILIKIADRIHNIQTIEGFKPEKRKEYLQETNQDLIPLFKKVLQKNAIKKYSLHIEKLLDILHQEVTKAENQLS